jgi:hypothetical protein
MEKALEEWRKLRKLRKLKEVEKAEKVEKVFRWDDTSTTAPIQVN